MGTAEPGGARLKTRERLYSARWGLVSVWHEIRMGDSQGKEEEGTVNEHSGGKGKVKGGEQSREEGKDEWPQGEMRRDHYHFLYIRVGDTQRVRV